MWIVPVSKVWELLLKKHDGHHVLDWVEQLHMPIRFLLLGQQVKLKVNVPDPPTGCGMGQPLWPSLRNWYTIIPYGRQNIIARPSFISDIRPT
ncbi:hypothetical protein D2V93_06795 [Flagellimonas taeanensis]|uniref:hypothetical protein n=1 Tax=Allomuricauda sp. ANG21 TaxID=3042468 RepID=UPI000E6A913B|nr:hypothetical protein D2V93_06795 [Allomuricauda taeanensis]